MGRKKVRCCDLDGREAVLKDKFWARPDMKRM